MTHLELKENRYKIAMWLLSLTLERGNMTLQNWWSLRNKKTRLTRRVKDGEIFEVYHPMCADLYIDSSGDIDYRGKLDNETIIELLRNAVR